MVRHGAFAYTWDIVGDPAAPGRIADLGVDTVTLQAAYHAVRAVTPWHPAHRIVHARHAAGYFRVRPERWRGRRLRPVAPNWGVPQEDRFGAAATALVAVGLRVEAWLVLTHSSRLGAVAPDLTARTAYGERFGYALCPSHAEVREYALTLVAEVCEQYDLAAVMLEACGWLGFEHGSHHEKTAGADLSPVARASLSICLCAACGRRLGARGLDANRIGEQIRAAVDGEVQRGVVAGVTLDDVLGPDEARLLDDHRAEVIAELAGEAAALAGDRPALLMAADDPRQTGPDTGVDAATFGAPVGGLVLKCWSDGEAAVARMKSAASRTATPLIANVSVLEDHPGDIPDLVGRLLDAGASQVRYYHAGLASAARLGTLRAAVRNREL